MRWVAALEYRGDGFAGWQRQPDCETVQGALERAIAAIAGEPVTVHAAGRTDAGVHATMQVVHFDTDVRRPDTAWVRGVNSGLPDTVSVLWARSVPDHFHARFSAMRRRYRYFLLNHPVRPALLTSRVGWTHQRLDIDAMREAAALLLGEHDFSAFRASECQAKSPIKDMQCLDIVQHGAMLEFRLSANAFLHHMVRNIVGALVHIGAGRKAPEWMAALLASRDRTQGAPMFSADGLYLAGVNYPAEFDLPTWEDDGRLFW